MHSPWMPFDCPEDACKSVQSFSDLRSELGVVSARPWNRHHSRETAWFLTSPDADGGWPNASGNYVFEFGADASQLVVGLHVSKGLSAEAAGPLDRGKDDVVLSDRWMWRRFIADLRRGMISKVLRRMNAAAGLDVHIDAVLKNETRSGSTGAVGDVAKFAVARDGLVLRPLNPSTATVLRPFALVKNDSDLAAALEAVDVDTWINVYIAATFACGPEASRENAWTPDRLWSDLLKPLAAWFGPPRA